MFVPHIHDEHKTQFIFVFIYLFYFYKKKKRPATQGNKIIYLFRVQKY